MDKIVDKNSGVTHCNSCVFRVMYHDEQVGCKVRQFSSEDYFLTPAIDGEKCWAVKRLCQFKRSQEWQLKKLKEDIEIKYSAFVEWGPNVKETLDSLVAQQIKPSRVNIVCYQQNGEDAYNLIKDYNIPWKVTEIVDDVTDWRDGAMKQSPSQLYLFIQPGHTLPPDYFSTLNDKIHWEDLRFGIIQSDDLLIVPHGLYTMVLSPLRIILENLTEIGCKVLNEDFSPKV